MTKFIDNYINRKYDPYSQKREKMEARKKELELMEKLYIL
jgi:hypothetical protein